MKTWLRLGTLLLATVWCAGAGFAQDDRSAAVSALAGRIDWLESAHEYGGACIRIRADRVVYVDPAALHDAAAEEKADLILVTHSHDDHFSPTTLAALRKPTTRIVTVAACAEKLPAEWGVVVITPGEQLTVDGVAIEAIPAYNLASGAHPRSAGGVGYVVTLGGVRIYLTGDTSFTPEVAGASKIDILVADLRAPYQMSPHEAAEAAVALAPAVLVPVHWLPAERAWIDEIRRLVPPRTRVVVLH